MNKISEHEAIQMIAEAFNEPVNRITRDAVRADIEGWDSMGALVLIAELDERFDLELTAETSRGMQRVSDVVDFLRTHGALHD